MIPLHTWQPAVCAILDQSLIPQHSKARLQNHRSAHFLGAWCAADGRCLEHLGAECWSEDCHIKTPFMFLQPQVPYLVQENSFIMHLLINQPLYSLVLYRKLRVCWRTSRGAEKWLGQKVSFTCCTKLHHLWERWITGTVKQVCHEMKWKKMCFYYKLFRRAVFYFQDMRAWFC